MEWLVTLIIIGGLLLAFLLSGIPVAFAFDRHFERAGFRRATPQ